VPERDDERGGRAWRELAAYLGLGTSLVILVLIGIGLGRYLDRRLGTEPAFFWVGALAGLAAAGWEFFRQVTKKR
jgi:F0F1-type ATP synthase assembly protein I